jgi:hypothetical protein
VVHSAPSAPKPRYLVRRIVLAGTFGLTVISTLVAINWRWLSDSALASRLERTAAAIREAEGERRRSWRESQAPGMELLRDEDVPLLVSESKAEENRLREWLDWRGAMAANDAESPARFRQLARGGYPPLRLGSASVRRTARSEPLREPARRALDTFGPAWLVMDPAADHLARRMSDLATDLRDRRRMRLITHDRVGPNEFQLSAELRYLQYRVWGDAQRRLWGNRALGLAMPFAGVSGEVPSIPLDWPTSTSAVSGVLSEIQLTEELGLVLVSWSLEAGKGIDETARDLQKLSPHLLFDLRLGRRELEIRDRRLRTLEPIPRARTTVVDPTDRRAHTVFAGSES